MVDRTRNHVFCLTAALAACVLLAQFAPVSGNRRVLKQEGDFYPDTAVLLNEYYKGDGPGDGPNQYKEEAYSEHESYEGRGDRPGHYHREEHYEGGDGGPGGYYHKEEHHNKLDVKTFTMQMTGTVPVRDSESTNAANFLNRKSRSTFRCALPEDEPDFCLNPSYPESKYGGHRNKFFSDHLERKAAAECTWFGVGTPGGCPSSAPAATCMPASINCTFTPIAGECGCPFKGSAYFTAKGFAILSQVDSCEAAYPPDDTNMGRRRLASASYDDPYDRAEPNISAIVNVTALIFRGKINSVVTTEGVKEAKGRVEFIPFFDDTGSRRLSSVGGRLGRIKARKLEVPADTAAANYDAGFNDLGFYPGERPDSYYHSEGPDGYYNGEGPMKRRSSGSRDYSGEEGSEYYSGEDSEYYPGGEDPEYDSYKYGFGPDDNYHSYRGKVLVKGGSLRVTLLENEYY